MSAPRLMGWCLVVLMALSAPALALTPDEINTAPFVADPAPPPAASPSDATKEKPAKSQSGKAGMDKAARKRDRDKPKGPQGLIVKVQVLLARKSISPGEIDGRDGENYRKALAQFRRQNALGEGDRLDEATWAALGGPAATDVVTTYTVTAKDARMRFPRTIPHDFAKQARMKRLDFTGPTEMYAERFHMSEGLLKALNPRLKTLKAGDAISVLQVAHDRPIQPVERMEAVKATGMLVLYGPGDAIIASYPATIGSADTPSPEGEYTVLRIAHDPRYEYDPKKNFQQGRNTRRLMLPPGPNNPVGTVWIALSKPTFGIHGTPAPSQVSKTSSHGCVRLTNWDAEEVAALIKPGVKMRFVEPSGS